MNYRQIIHKSNFSLFPVLILMLSGCINMSEIERDASAGLNGGFEVSRNGLPVNWYMYTPKTVPKSDFKITLDTDNYLEGKQSLKFDVRECRSTGGRLSPGFTNELFHEGSGKFNLSFWVMNDGSEFKMTLSGVIAKSGGDEVIIQSSERMTNWTRFEENIEVPEAHVLRLNLNIIQPGTFWIDDLKIEGL